MTLRNFKQLANKLTNNGKNAHRAVAMIFVASIGVNTDPLAVEGWHQLFRPITVPEFAKNPDIEKITAGLPGGLILNLPKEDSREYTLEGDMYNNIALDLARVSDASVLYRYATDGQSTVATGSTPTNKTVTVETGDGAEYQKGDTILVNLKSVTYKGWDEITVITDVTGDVITFEPISFAPATGATIKKIAGKVSGTTKANTGIYLPDTLTLEFERVQLLVVQNLPNSRSLHISHVPIFEITKGTMPDFTKPLATVKIMGTPILAEEKSFTLKDGTTENLSYYVEHYIVPYEAA